MTQALARVVVSVAVGAPEAAFADETAPIAPDPIVPEVSTPAMLTTVSDAADACASVAVTDTLDSGAAANARQISDTPRCTFVWTTSCHVSPAPLIAVTAFPAAR